MYCVLLKEQYDHIPHPGPLPRSFIPPLIIAAGSKPFLMVAEMVMGNERDPLVDQVVGKSLSFHPSAIRAAAAIEW